MTIKGVVAVNLGQTVVVIRVKPNLVYGGYVIWYGLLVWSGVGLVWAIGVVAYGIGVGNWCGQLVWSSVVLV